MFEPTKGILENMASCQQNPKKSDKDDLGHKTPSLRHLHHNCMILGGDRYVSSLKSGRKSEYSSKNLKLTS